MREVDGERVTSAKSLREALAKRTEAKAARVLVAFDRGMTQRLAVLERDVK